MEPEESDDVLLRRMAEADESALKAFFHRHSGGVARFVQGFSNEPADVADVVNDVFFDVWRGAGSFSGRSKPRTWLFAIARNKATDRIRKRARHDAEALDPERADEGVMGALDRVIEKDRASMLRNCISRLPTAHRSIVHLTFYENLGYREIGDVLGIPEGTVKSRVFHIKSDLLRCLERIAGARNI